MKIEIDYIETTDDIWEHFLFRQEGSPGYKLPACWLREFVEALESPANEGRICVYNNIHVLNAKKQSLVFKSSQETPLLSITSEQRAKLIAHLRSTYAALM